MEGTVDELSTIQEVAKKANVSVSTVSRAFREGVSISEDKRQKVLAVASELGYSPNLLARGLKSSSTRTIGVICNITTPFYVDIINVIESELEKLGYQMLLAPNVSTSERERYYLELMSGFQVAGIIFLPTENDNEVYIRQLCKKGISMVQMFRYPYDFLDSVVVDDERGAYLATEELLKKGHRKILLMDVLVSYAYQRSAGYIKAFREWDLPVDKEMIQCVNYIDLENIHEILQKYKPTAVISGVHDVGRILVKYSQKYRISIPEDLSVIMFDDVEWMELMRFDTIAQPIDYIGISACRLLADRITRSCDSDTPISLVLQPRMIARSSVKKLQ